ncbi:hypothetical protein FQN57_002847 [Myotisia sp. PD_48]|nr:hypothetical protein FQN57_002847 [Myotisia sp. PD_48]
METLKKVGRFFAPTAEKEDDGRDVWGSRASFVLAAMGGAVGLGNLLRYPSVVFLNNGLQWFIPYLIALVMLAIPLLALEISIGQAFRGGAVSAYEHINKRAKGVGLGIVFTGYAVVSYYVAILSWVMIYFRNSFKSPLPWTDRVEEFYMKDVIANSDPVPGNYSDDGKSVLSYTSYPGTGLIGETVGWAAFTWFTVWLCMFKGVGLTGRVVYFTMGLPIIMVFVLMGRALSLPDAIEGVKMYMGHWDGAKLASGDIWQAACGQIFFSVGVGFGYFISYASYNSKYSNAVQDAVIIGCSNSLFEIVAAFAVFGVIGNLGLKPDDGVELGTFTVSFLTYPHAVVQMPGSNVWAVLWYFTVMVLGLSSAFALLETLVTMIMDNDWGNKYPRWLVSTVAVVISFLLTLMYCTEFGYYLLDAVDTWINNLSLLFVAWAEAIACTTLYRHRNVIDQVGMPSYGIFNGGYLAATIIGLIVAHTVSPEAGAGTGFGIFIVATIIAVFLARVPDVVAPSFWGKNTFLTRFWWLAFYSGVQLSRDLNVVIAVGKNWKLPAIWGPILKYISAPILSIIIAFAYPAFYKKRADPLHIFAFAIAHIAMLSVVFGVIVPRAFSIFVAPHVRDAAKPLLPPGQTRGTTSVMDSLERDGKPLEEQMSSDYRV